MVQHISKTAFVGATILALSAAVSTANGAVLFNSGFEDLTGSNPSHFGAGLLLDGHASASSNPSSSAQIYVTADPAPQWSVDTSAGGTMNPTVAIMPPGPLDGQNVGYSNGAILAQVMSWDIEPSTTYSLTIGVGHTTLPGAFAYHVWLSSGGFVLAEDANGTSIPTGTWGTSTVTWQSPGDVQPGSKLTINLASDDGVVFFDNVQLVGGSIAPEPAATSMLLLPALAALKRRRR